MDWGGDGSEGGWTGELVTGLELSSLSDFLDFLFSFEGVGAMVADTVVRIGPISASVTEGTEDEASDSDLLDFLLFFLSLEGEEWEGVTTFSFSGPGDTIVDSDFDVSSDSDFLDFLFLEGLVASFLISRGGGGAVAEFPSFPWIGSDLGFI